MVTDTTIESDDWAFQDRESHAISIFPSGIAPISETALDRHLCARYGLVVIAGSCSRFCGF